jgi:acyl-CoA reductase-like NAD-dependent aldehyde dehydrogenase
MADRIEESLEAIAIAESWENGKACRETLAADIPLAVDHLRYFAGAARAQEGSLSEIDENTIAYHFHEPLGVVGQIIPWNRSSWRSGSSPRPWPPATRSCSNRPNRRPRRSTCSTSW